jgi:hypothetical protein
MDEILLQELEKTLSEKFPAGIPRSQLSFATGGIVKGPHAANMDCHGVGIKGRFKVGKLTVYPTKNVVEFIRSKTIAVIEK